MFIGRFFTGTDDSRFSYGGPISEDDDEQFRRGSPW
jgi:hypothetical protein